MKKLLTIIILLASTICSAQPKSYVDSVTVFNGTLLEWKKGNPTVRGTIPASHPPAVDSLSIDVNYFNDELLEWKSATSKIIGSIAKGDEFGNIFLGYNPIIINSTENLIQGRNVVLNNAHGNLVHANNAELYGVQGCSVFGADHKIFAGADYCNVSGDAHTEIRGYASNTSGFGNINNVEYGEASGLENRLGRTGIANEFNSSSVAGYKNIVEGSYSHATGKFLKLIGNNIIAIGNGISASQPMVITQAGFYIIKNGIIVSQY